MKAVVSTKQGPPEVLQVQEVEKPQPGDGEILVKVHAGTVTRGDVIMRKMNPLMLLPMRLFGIKKKRTPGHELAGEVVEVGKNVTRFAVGDKVFGTTTGLSVGANAEYVRLPENWKSGVLVKMPKDAAYEEVAAIPVGGMTALDILNKGKIKPGDKVLIYGASGSVGTYAVQLAKKHFDAIITGVCSTKNVTLVKVLGADEVIDYTETDISQIDQKFDVVFDAVGKLSSADAKALLKEGGTLLSVRTPTKESEENLQILADLFEAGKLKVVTDCTYPLEQIVAAHQRVESGHKVGNVVITMNHGE
jgi:alcohol dehydrogenase